MSGLQGKQRSGYAQNVNQRTGISQEKLKSILDYDRETGVFTWKKSYCSHSIIGKKAGNKHPNGYIRIQVLGKMYRAHRLAWLIVYGYLPENAIDHINRNASDNRISNLREVSTVCNIRNTGNFSHNTSGVKGVCWSKSKNMWEPKIKVMGLTKHLGRYRDFDDAVCARLAAEQCLEWEGCDKSSPAYKYVNKVLKQHRGGTQ